MPAVRLSLPAQGPLVCSRSSRLAPNHSPVSPLLFQRVKNRSGCPEKNDAKVQDQGLKQGAGTVIALIRQIFFPSSPPVDQEHNDDWRHAAADRMEDPCPPGLICQQRHEWEEKCRQRDWDAQFLPKHDIDPRRLRCRICGMDQREILANRPDPWFGVYICHGPQMPDFQI